MTRIQLRVYADPGQAELFLNLKQKDGSYYSCTAVVDTGAEVSLFPETLLPLLDYRLTERGHFIIEQAGIAQQSFTAIEVYITVYLEDISGARTQEFEIRAWFTNTVKYLAGFDGLLTRAVLHLDMPNLSGYLEFS